MVSKFLMTLAAAVFLQACAASPDYDLIIRGGTVYSGTNEPGRTADVAIKGDRIVAIGELAGKSAARELSAENLAVTPGFIDIHSHALRGNAKRSGIYRWPEAENLIRQGVTTVIGGPDGGSPLPLSADLDRLEAQPAGVNFGTFVGQGSVRRQVVGEERRAASADEIQRMREVVDQAMHDGAFGLSSGLIYAPGSFASTEEVVELAKITAHHGGIYISHMRDEAQGLLDSVEETIHIGEAAGLPAQITHFKAMGKPMWGKSGEAIALVDAAIDRGVDVSIDQYPYDASSTSLRAVFPQWALSGDRATRNARLENPDSRAKVKRDMITKLRLERGGDDADRIRLAYCAFDPTLNGKTVKDVLLGRDQQASISNAADLIMDMEAAGGCTAVYHAMNEIDVKRIMQHPATMISSDGGIEVPGQGMPHPRNYGAFARVLGRYVRELELMPLHTAIQKMSLLPAQRLGLADRGELRVGAIADIAVFDPATIIDTAGFENPHQYAIGMQHVLVAGEIVLNDGQMTGKKVGRVLRHSLAR
ncbi:MAG: D-aminoacylase [Pseudomonadota bacterium]